MNVTLLKYNFKTDMFMVAIIELIKLVYIIF